MIGVPMDFRLGFGASFGEDTRDRRGRLRRARARHPRPVAAELYGGVAATLDALRSAAAGGPDRAGWNRSLREAENEKRAGEQDELTDDRAPLHPMRALPRAAAGARARRGRDRRRRRLRLLRRPRDRHLRAGLLDGPRAVRVPRLRPRLRAGRQARAPRPPGVPAARRRRVRLRGHGVRHARAPRRARSSP